MLLALSKYVFIEKVTAGLWRTKHICINAMIVLMWYIKYLYRYHGVEDKFFALASLNVNNMRMRPSEPQGLY